MDNFESLNLTKEEVNSDEETFNLDSSVIACLATEVLDTPRDAHANVDSNGVSFPSIPGFRVDDTSHEAECTDVTEARDDYDTLLTHSIHSVTCFIDEETSNLS